MSKVLGKKINELEPKEYHDACSTLLKAIFSDLSEVEMQIIRCWYGKLPDSKDEISSEAALSCCLENIEPKELCEKIERSTIRLNQAGFPNTVYLNRKYKFLFDEKMGVFKTAKKVYDLLRMPLQKFGKNVYQINELEDLFKNVGVDKSEFLDLFNIGIFSSYVPHEHKFTVGIDSHTKFDKWYEYVIGWDFEPRTKNNDVVFRSPPSSEYIPKALIIQWFKNFQKNEHLIEKYEGVFHELNSNNPSKYKAASTLARECLAGCFDYLVEKINKKIKKEPVKKHDDGKSGITRKDKARYLLEYCYGKVSKDKDNYIESFAEQVEACYQFLSSATHGRVKDVEIEAKALSGISALEAVLFQLIDWFSLSGGEE